MYSFNGEINNVEIDYFIAAQELPAFSFLLSYLGCQSNIDFITLNVVWKFERRGGGGGGIYGYISEADDSYTQGGGGLYAGS